MQRSTFRTKRSAYIGLLVAASGGVAAIAAAGGGTSSAAPIPQAQPGTFSILKASASPVPVAARASLEEKLPTLEPAESALVTRTSSYSAYAVSSATPGLVCLYAAGSDGSTMVTCPNEVGQPAAFIDWGSAFGVVPDTVKSVSFAMTDGSTQVGAVSANTWHAPAEAKLATYVDGGLERSVELMPLSEKPKDWSTLPSGK